MHTGIHGELLKIKDLSFTYEDGNKVLDGLNLTAHDGESIGIVGANGIGKSTLMKLLVGLYLNYEGELEVAVKKLGFPACYILQPPSLVRKGSDRFGEKAGVVALRAFNAIGLMRAYKPMPTEEVAAAMVRLVKGGRRATETIVAQDILKA